MATVHLLVSTVTRQTYDVNVSTDTNADGLAEEVSKACGIPAEYLRFIYNGKQLDQDESEGEDSDEEGNLSVEPSIFKAFGINNGDTVHMVVNMQGGRRWRRRRKDWRTPKKTKHQKKKEKLAVLRQYKVAEEYSSKIYPPPKKTNYSSNYSYHSGYSQNSSYSDSDFEVVNLSTISSRISRLRPDCRLCGAKFAMHKTYSGGLYFNDIFFPGN